MKRLANIIVPNSYALSLNVTSDDIANWRNEQDAPATAASHEAIAAQILRKRIKTLIGSVGEHLSLLFAYEGAVSLSL